MLFHAMAKAIKMHSKMANKWMWYHVSMQKSVPGFIDRSATVALVRGGHKGPLLSPMPITTVSIRLIEIKVTQF